MRPLAPVDELTGIEAARFGVYVHFPYCLSKCPYCDFASTAAKQVPAERYTKAVLTELERRAPEVGRREVHSIYFGGGTPSLWAPTLVGQVLEALGTHFAVAPGAEITLEANPGAADAARFAGYRAAGVNRLSIGVQSFQPTTLKTLGREHDGPTAVAAYEKARAAGFDNVSLDFIYGVHGQSLEQALDDAKAAAALGPEHLSAYALTLDAEALAEEVPLAKQLQRGEVTLPDDDTVVQMQRQVADAFAAVGLERYEVSNYAKPGYHSRHNALYWTGGEYLALGVGATGTVGHGRYSNQRSAEKYLQQVEAGALPEAKRESLIDAELHEERLAMGLRLTSGVALSTVANHAELPRLEREGLAVVEHGRLRLTPRGFDVHSAIAARLM